MNAQQRTAIYIYLEIEKSFSALLEIVLGWTFAIVTSDHDLRQQRARCTKQFFGPSLLCHCRALLLIIVN